MKLWAGSGEISIVAGVGSTWGYYGNGVGVLNASLWYPTDVAFDTSGNLLFSEFYVGRVRRVVNGIVTTIVGGNTFPSFCGDGQNANLSCFNSITGLAMDPSSGILYVSDFTNQRVRQVLPNMTVHTIIGNGTCTFYGEGIAGLQATLCRPHGLHFDSPSGKLYIADAGSNRIRALHGGIITTVAGTGAGLYGGDGGLAIAAFLRNPIAVTCDTAGNVYIADALNGRIRLVFLNGTITTVAGGGTDGTTEGLPALRVLIGNPNGVAVALDGTIYFSDTTANRVRKVGGDGKVVTVVGNGFKNFNGVGPMPAMAMALSSPRSVAVAPSGLVAITDFGNCMVKALAADGTMTTYAGSTVCGQTGDGFPATTATLTSPAGLAFDASNNLYIADFLACKVRMVSARNGLMYTVAGNGNCAFGGDGTQATSAPLSFPCGVDIDANQNIVVLDSQNSRVRVVSAQTGVIVTVAGDGQSRFWGDGGPATLASFNYPLGVAVDAKGQIVVADTKNNRIRVISTNGTINSLCGGGGGGDGGLAIFASISAPSGDLAIDRAGNIFFGDTVNSRVRVILAATGIIQTIAGNGLTAYYGDGGPATSAAVNNPYGVALDEAGNLYIAEWGSNRVRIVYNVSSPTRPSSASPTLAPSPSATPSSGSGGGGGGGSSAIAPIVVSSSAAAVLVIVIAGMIVLCVARLFLGCFVYRNFPACRRAEVKRQRTDAAMAKGRAAENALQVLLFSTATLADAKAGAAKGAGGEGKSSRTAPADAPSLSRAVAISVSQLQDYKLRLLYTNSFVGPDAIFFPKEGIGGAYHLTREISAKVALELSSVGGALQQSMAREEVATSSSAYSASSSSSSSPSSSGAGRSLSGDAPAISAAAKIVSDIVMAAAKETCRLAPSPAFLWSDSVVKHARLALALHLDDSDGSPGTCSDPTTDFTKLSEASIAVKSPDDPLSQPDPSSARIASFAPPPTHRPSLRHLHILKPLLSAAVVSDNVLLSTLLMSAKALSTEYVDIVSTEEAALIMEEVNAAGKRNPSFFAATSTIPMAEEAQESEAVSEWRGDEMHHRRPSKVGQRQKAGRMTKRCCCCCGGGGGAPIDRSLDRSSASMTSPSITPRLPLLLRVLSQRGDEALTDPSVRANVESSSPSSLDIPAVLSILNDMGHATPEPNALDSPRGVIIVDSNGNASPSNRSGSNRLPGNRQQAYFSPSTASGNSLHISTGSVSTTTRYAVTDKGEMVYTNTVIKSSSIRSQAAGVGPTLPRN